MAPGKTGGLRKRPSSAYLPASRLLNGAPARALMIFGRGGAGGVVNRVTKKPALDGVADVGLTVGSWNQVRDTIDVGRKMGDSSAWRLNAMAENSGSFRKDVNLRRWAVNPTVLVQGESSTLTLGCEHLNDERTADRGIPSQNGRPYSTDPGNFFGNAAQSNAQSYVISPGAPRSARLTLSLAF